MAKPKSGNKIPLPNVEESTPAEVDATPEKGAENEASKGGIPIKKDYYESAKAASGAKSFDSGDGVAQNLRGKTLDEAWEALGGVLKKVKNEDIDVADLQERWAHLNKGMIRMNIGTKIRTVLRKAGKQMVDNKVVDAPKEEKAA